jgi:AraC-like DNA-binding protein
LDVLQPFVVFQAPCWTFFCRSSPIGRPFFLQWAEEDVMPETRQDLLRHAAAPAYRRIDRDLRAAPEAVRPMLRVIRSNLFEQDLGVERIRVVLGLRSSRDPKRFRRALGTTVARYIEDRRLETSCRLLVGSDLELDEVAARVGYRRYKTWHDVFRRRIGCQPKLYRKTGGLPAGTPAAGAGEPAAAAVEPGLPRFLAGIAELPLESSCVRCGSGLPPGPAARVFEDLDPLCDLCALEHAPRELADFLFVNAPHRRRQPRELLDRITEPEKILAGLRRQLSRVDAERLIWALLCRYPASAGVVGEIFGLREQERERRLETRADLWRLETRGDL